MNFELVDLEFHKQPNTEVWTINPGTMVLSVNIKHYMDTNEWKMIVYVNYNKLIISLSELQARCIIDGTETNVFECFLDNKVSV